MSVHVECPGGCAWPLDFNAADDRHAANLLRKHYREHHEGQPVPGAEPPPLEPSPPSDGVPEQLDLSAAARWLVRLETHLDEGEVSQAHLTAAMAVWTFLTGLSAEPAWQLARQLAAADRPVYAYVPTF